MSNLEILRALGRCVCRTLMAPLQSLPWAGHEALGETPLCTQTDSDICLYTGTLSAQQGLLIGQLISLLRLLLMGCFTPSI